MSAKNELNVEQLTLALIAHDSKKQDMITLVKAHKQELSDVTLIATKNTGQMLQSNAKLPVTLLQSGPKGGDQQIGALVANGDVKAIIFLRDPLTAQPHEPDITALMRICDVHNIPLATNLATTEAVLRLMFEHLEALTGHHLIAQYLEDVAMVHEG